jgi:valine--pyruvate aminotransferase
MSSDGHHGPKGFGLSRQGQKITKLTGVRAIMRDIAEGYRASPGQLINLSAGNPLVIPEVANLWNEGFARTFEKRERFNEVVGRYGETQGYKPLIDRIVQTFRTVFDWPIGPRNVLIAPGTQALYFFAASLYCERRAESSRSLVLPINPDYTGYQGVCLDQVEVVSSEIGTQQTSPHTFRYSYDFAPIRAYQGQVGILMFSRPTNPTGFLLPDKSFQELIQIAEQRSVPLLVDCAYGLPFPAVQYGPSAFPWHHNVVYCFSLSKAGLPGERIGIAIGNEDVIRDMESYQSNANIHASRLGQAVLEDRLADGGLLNIGKEVIAPYYVRKRAVLMAAMERELEGLDWRLHDHQGSLFSWLWLPWLGVDDVSLYSRLKKERLILVPGSAFFHNCDQLPTSLTRCFRISLTATDEHIEEGIRILARVLRELA